MHARYLAEIEKLTRKLQQRDDTLRRVLHAKSNLVPNKPAAKNRSAAEIVTSYPISTKGNRD